ncbi:MAG: hypothetical protein JOZ78_20375 [Chroococcidiopsidaceae cyanobacterium CP_BM_ER_R8_30]|nr:hypothetical protein [Chroococcidiopsidaceae cyanobacterium CP_BM_ER_R8_30]
MYQLHPATGVHQFFDVGEVVGCLTANLPCF